MSNARRRMVLASFKLLDVAIMVGSFALATVPVLYENQNVSLAEFFSMRVKVQNFILFLGLVLAWHAILKAMGLYKSGGVSGLRQEALDSTKAVFVGTLCLGLAAALAHIRMVDFLFLAVFWIASTAATVTSRVAVRYFLERAHKRGHNLRSVLIVGSNRRALELARRIESRPDSGYRVAGFADDPWEGAEALSAGYPLLSDLSHLADFFRKVAIDDVVMALPLKSF